MINTQFLLQQQEKIINETLSVKSLTKDRKIRSVEGFGMSSEQGLEFIQFKQNLIDLIKNSDEKALLERLQVTKSRMCSKCQTGLKTFELGCAKDYGLFVTCEYIKRSIS